jgi:hypothetical protein
MYTAREGTPSVARDEVQNMLPTGGWLAVLRGGLFLSTFGWGISFFFTIESWTEAVNRLYSMGASEITYQPLLAYWLKMASAVFGCIGLVSALAFVWPQRFASVIYMLAPFHLIVGTTLAMAAASNHLSPKLHPTFVLDLAFCFTTTALIGVPLVCTCRQRRRTCDVASNN